MKFLEKLKDFIIRYVTPCVILILLWAMFISAVSKLDFSKRDPIKQSILEDYPVVVESVQVEKAPTKIVCLDQNICMLIDGMGKTSTIVAVSSENEEELFVETQKVGTILELDVEAIIAFAPDILLTSKSLMYKDVTALSESGVKIITFDEEYDFSKNLNLLFNGNL